MMNEDEQPPPRRIPTEHQAPIVVQSPGVIGVASETIGALKASPLLLLVVLLNAAFVGVGAWYLTNQQRSLERTVSNILNRCLPDVHGEAFILPPGGVPQVPTENGGMKPPKETNEPPFQAAP